MNRERVQELRNVIAGIPEDQINLDGVQMLKRGHDTVFREDADEIGPCGSICCIAGWAWLYPPFIGQGIRRSRSLNRVQAAAKFFDVSALTFDSEFDDAANHKQIALRRLDKLLEEK